MYSKGHQTSIHFFSGDFVFCDCPYQVADLIQQIVDLCTIGQPDVGLAQQSADLLPDLGLGHSHHHHEGCDIIQHVGQQLILIMFESLPLQISQGNIPAKSWQKTVQAIPVFIQFYYNNHFLNFLDRKSPVNHLCRPLVHSNNISFLCYCIQKHIFPELHLIPQTASIFSCKITTIHICIILTISSL